MRKLALIFFVLGSLCSACESSTYVDIDAVIEEKVQARLDQYRAVLDSRCRERALEEAGRQADSIVLSIAKAQKDTFDRPIRPFRPEKPALMELEDSMALAPLFDTLGN